MKEIHVPSQSQDEALASPRSGPEVTLPGNIILLNTGFGPTQCLSAGLNVKFSGIAHRKWLYGTALVRGEITLLASPGGVGKSSLAISESTAIATGRRLLGEKIWQPDLTALYINAEDSSEEISRRVWAVCLNAGIPESELLRLFVLGSNDWRTQKLSFLRSEKSATTLDRESFDFFESLISALRPDVVVLDPLVALCGGGNLNDNSAMSLVMRALKRLANDYHCAIYILHHTRKGGDLTNAEAIGGASAIVNLARRALQAVPMTAEEAQQNGVLPSERSSFFKIVSSKANLVARSEDTSWYRLRSVSLPNADPPLYPNGDNVQAVERVALPMSRSVSHPLEASIRQAILRTVDAGKIIDGKTYPYSPNISGAANRRGLLNDAVAAAALATGGSLNANDLSAIVQRSIRNLLREGSLVAGEIALGRFRRAASVQTDWSKARWADKPISEGDDPAGDSEGDGNECGAGEPANAVN